MLTAPANRQIAVRPGPRLATMTGHRQPATGRVRRPRRGLHRATRALIGTLVLLTTLVVPAYAVSTGRVGWFERLVPREEALRLTGYLGEAPPETIILLFVGIFAFLLVVWAAVCAATYTLGAVFDRARHGA